MEENICRRFVLHNDFIPPTNEKHQWDYLAFGYKDGLSSKGNIFTTGNQTLKRVWEDIVDYTKNTKEMEQAQVIYGFRNERDEDNKDKEFWGGKGADTEFFFTFFVMLQLQEDNSDHVKQVLENREKLEQKFTREEITGEKSKALIYLTMENSDFFLVLRTNNYNYGAGIIDDIHRKSALNQDNENTWRIKYSFTVSSIDKEFLNNKATQLSAVAGEVPCAYIYVTERYAGSIDSYYKKLEEMLKGCAIDNIEKHIFRQSVLGYDDELIILKEIPWSTFLGLYKDGTGLLNHTNAEYQRYVGSLTTIIGLIQNQGGSKEIRGNEEAAADEKKWGALKKYRDNLYVMIKKISECESNYPTLHYNMVMSLYTLIHSFSKFIKVNVSENQFFPVSSAVYMLVELLKELLADGKALDVQLCYEDYQRFLKALNSYAQNSTHSDRQFTQAMEFHVNVYNLPVKLIAFYSAFIYFVKENLKGAQQNDEEQSNGEVQSKGEGKQNDKNHSYEFLICPGVVTNMHVQSIFREQSATKKLFLVNIPESQAYNLQLMMIMLCHEIGHFVGSNIRNRSIRKSYLTSAYCKMVTLFYKNKLSEFAGEKYCEFWTEFEELMKELVGKRLEECNTLEWLKRKYVKSDMQDMEDYENELQKVQDLRAERMEHSGILKENLLDAMVSVVRNDRNRLFGKAIYIKQMSDYSEHENKRMAEKKKSEIELNIEKKSFELLSSSRDCSTELNLQTMLSILTDMYKECLSDVISIILLQLTPNQYFNALYQNLMEQGKTDVFKGDTINEVTIRAALVTHSLYASVEGIEKEENWQEESLKVKNIEPEMQHFYQNVLRIIREFITNKNNEHKNIQTDQVCSYLCNHRVMNDIWMYLLNCRKTLAEQCKNKNPKYSKLQEIFKISALDNIDEVMCRLHLYVNEYHEEIYKIMEEMTALS